MLLVTLLDLAFTLIESVLAKSKDQLPLELVEALQNAVDAWLKAKPVILNAPKSSTPAPTTPKK